MLHITQEGNKVIVSCGHLSAELKGLNGLDVAYVEDALRQVLQTANVSHKVRDFAELKYPVSSKLYLGRDRSALLLEAECGEVAEFSGPLVPLRNVFDLAGVYYVCE